MTPSFDWVTARSECSLNRFFDLLRERIDTDVKKINELNRRGIKFTLNTDISADKLIVSRERDCGAIAEHLAIVFERHENSISIRKRAAQIDEALFDGAPTMNEHGECVFTVGDDSLRIWQVSRKALESLFFQY